MKTFNQTKPIPKLIRWGIIFIIIGVIFPIYGTPAGFLGLPRITFFRLGLLILILSLYMYRISIFPVLIKQKPVAFLCLLFIFRLMSLVLTSDINFINGVTQIWWYSQGLLCLVSILALQRHWPQLKRYLYSKIFLFGTIASIFSFYQFIQLVTLKNVSHLPFAMTKFGLVDGLYESWYPLGPGGRIVGSFFDPNMTGTFLVLFLCLLLPNVSFKSGKKFPLYLLIMSITIIAMVGTGSRQALAISALIIFIYIFVTIARKYDWTLKAPARIIFILIGLYFGYSFFNFMMSSREESFIFQGGNRVNAISRLKDDLQNGLLAISIAEAAGPKMLGTRYTSSQIMLSELSYKTLVLGEGEGEGYWSAHNAWIIVIYENGVWAVMFLFFAGYLMFIKAFKNARRFSKQKIFDPQVIAGPLIVISWLLMLTINWAQLNQSFPWIFLALVTMPPRLVPLQRKRTLVK
jgi:hypothetical protein